MPPQSLIIFIFQIIFIFLLSRFTINELFYTLRIFSRREKFVFSFISLVFFPGTVVHEISHFLAATILLLKVKDITIFPKFENNQIKLGSVLFEKKDIVRSIIVGLAPIISAMIIFWALSANKIFPGTNIWLNLAVGYFIFSVSSTMFSSAQDLEDLIFILPLAIIMIGIVYIFNIQIDIFLKNQWLITNFVNVISQINIFLFLSILINLFLIIFFKSLQFLFKK